jgi:structure-specific recognition protein 1
MAGVLQQFGRVFLQGQGREAGILKLEQGQVQWTSRSSEHTKSISSGDVAGATWIGLGGRRSQLRLKVGGSSVRFDGFRREDKATIKAFLSEHYSVDLATEDVSTRAGNWGKLSFKGNVVALQDVESGHTALEFPLNEVSLSSMPKGRPGEVEIQFQTDDTVAAKEETLVRMDLYIPTAADRDETEDFSTAVEAFEEKLKDSAGIRHKTGDAIVEIDESQGKFLAPHGRFAVEMHPKELRMKGRSYDPTVTYNHIDSLFVLPMPGDQYSAFVVALTVPIRQGQQRYFFLVMQLPMTPGQLLFNLDQDELNEQCVVVPARSLAVAVAVLSFSRSFSSPPASSPPSLPPSRYGDASGLAPEMKGPMHVLVAKTFKVLTKKKIFTAGSFKTSRGAQCIDCAFKNNAGLLYPLKRSFMFIHKPTKWIK